MWRKAASRRWVFLLATVLLAGCGGSSNGNGDGGGDGATDGSGGDGGDGYVCYENIDIVFVLDVSTSMGYILQTLENEIGQVWQAAQNLDDNPHFGLVVFVDDVTVVSGQPYASVAELQGDFHTWYSHTSTNQQTQSGALNTDWPENSLDALVAGASGFAWRPASNTLRVIIHASDDTFLEAPAAFDSGIQVQNTYDGTVQALRERFIRTACFAASLGGQFGDVDVSPGFLADYGGRSSIPEDTHAQAFDIDQVQAGSLSLTDAINGFVIQEVCQQWEP